MKYEEFKKLVPWDEFTAFVFDCHDGLVYSPCEVFDFIFDDTDKDTDFRVVPISDLPEVKKAIMDNFPTEVHPYDREARGNLVREIENARIGYWTEEKTTSYMLIK